jgi:hypothetical protein
MKQLIPFLLSLLLVACVQREPVKEPENVYVRLDSSELYSLERVLYDPYGRKEIAYKKPGQKEWYVIDTVETLRQSLFLLDVWKDDWVSAMTYKSQLDSIRLLLDKCRAQPRKIEHVENLQIGPK